MADDWQARIAKWPRPLVALGMAVILEAVLFLVSGVWDAGGHNVLPLFWHMPSLFLCLIVEASVPEWTMLPILFLGQVVFYTAVLWPALALWSISRAGKSHTGGPIRFTLRTLAAFLLLCTGVTALCFQRWLGGGLITVASSCLFIWGLRRDRDCLKSLDAEQDEEQPTQ